MRWGFWNRNRREQDLDDEIRAHLEIEARQRREAGESEQEARSHASRDFGNVPLVKETTRDSWGWARLMDLGRDMRYAARMLIKSPSYSLLGMLTMVLSIGSVVTAFALGNAVLFRAMDYPDAKRLVRLVSSTPERPFSTFAPADFVDLRDTARSFDGLGAVYGPVTHVIQNENDPYYLRRWAVSPDLLTMLGAQAVVGRLPFLADEAPDSPPVAVISDELWRSRMGSRGDVVGSTLRLGADEAYTIVGVFAPGFRMPTEQFNFYPEVWVTLAPGIDPRRQGSWWRVLGRLAPDVSLDAANAELETISERLASEFPATNQDRVARAELLLDAVVDEAAPVLWLFLAAVGCLLAIGIANLSGLQLVRNAARRHELHVRAALGAGRACLVRQLVSETILLSLVGGIGGLLAGYAATGIVVRFLPPGFPRADEIGFDLRVFAVAFAISLVAGLAWGLVPAWHASRPNVRNIIQEAGPTTTLSRRAGRWQGLLVGAETTLALVLLVTAALLTHSMLLLLTADVGIDENRLQVVHVELPLRYNSAPRDEMAVFWRGILEEIRRIPEVESAAISGNVLLAGMNDVSGVFAESGTRTGRENAIDVRYEVVTDGFFNAIGVPVVRGRPVLSTDVTGSEPVVVINEAAAQMLWSGAESLGQRVNILGRSFGVVGVVRDFRHEIRAVEIAPQFFVSALQDPVAGALHDDVAIVARRRPGTSGVLEALTATVRTFEPEARVTLGSTTEIRWLMTIAERLQAGVVLAIATMATSLAMVGIFGIVAYAVVQRRRETGIRIALGAGRRSVVALMIRFAMIPTLIGLAVGLGVSVAVSQLLQGFLFEVEPLDAATFVVAVLLFLAAATIAGVVPARRALRIDPMTVLREE